MNGVLFVVLNTAPTEKTPTDTHPHQPGGADHRKGPWLLPPAAFKVIVELIMEHGFHTPATKTKEVTLMQDKAAHPFTVRVYGTRTKYDISLQKGEEPPQPVTVFIAKRSGWRERRPDTSQRPPSYARAEPRFPPREPRPAERRPRRKPAEPRATEPRATEPRATEPRHTKPKQTKPKHTKPTPAPPKPTLPKPTMPAPAPPAERRPLPQPRPTEAARPFAERHGKGE